MRDLLADKKELEEYVAPLLVKHDELEWCVPREYAQEYIDRAIAAEKRALIAEKALAMACEDNYNSYRDNTIRSSCVARHWVQYWQDEAQKAI